MKTGKMKTVKVVVKEEGTNFGCCGYVVAGNHRVMAETRLYPYGCEYMARIAAEDIARQNGWVLSDVYADYR